MNNVGVLKTRLKSGIDKKRSFIEQRKKKQKHETKKKDRPKNLERVWVRDWGRTALLNGVVEQRC